MGGEILELSIWTLLTTHWYFSEKITLNMKCGVIPSSSAVNVEGLKFCTPNFEFIINSLIMKFLSFYYLNSNNTCQNEMIFYISIFEGSRYRCLKNSLIIIHIHFKNIHFSRRKQQTKYKYNIWMFKQKLTSGTCKYANSKLRILSQNTVYDLCKKLFSLQFVL